MKLKVPYDISNFTYDDPEFIKNLSQTINALAQIINGRINFSENCQVRIASVTFNSANVQQAINHGLNKVPSGFIMIGSKAAVRVYNGTTPNSAQVMYLQADVATTANLMIF